MNILLNVALLFLVVLIAGCADDYEEPKKKGVWEGVSDPVDRSRSKEFQP